jgi:hypothetical protein
MLIQFINLMYNKNKILKINKLSRLRFYQFLKYLEIHKIDEIKNNEIFLLFLLYLIYFISIKRKRTQYLYTIHFFYHKFTNMNIESYINLIFFFIF